MVEVLASVVKMQLNAGVPQGSVFGDNIVNTTCTKLITNLKKL